MTANIEQWRCFVAVVDCGGYAHAAEALNKSQSAVSYAVSKLEDSLGLRLFVMDGRKAALSSAGKALYQRAQQLLQDARSLEQVAEHLSAGWEPRVRLAVDTLFPQQCLLSSLEQFYRDCPHTQLELYESVLSGAEEALLEGRADIAISSYVPPGFIGEPLSRIRFVPVAAPSHPLHSLGGQIQSEQLRAHRQVVVRDSASKRQRDSGWLLGRDRLTVSRGDTGVKALCQGLGFAWVPEAHILPQLQRGDLKVLPLQQGAERFAQLHLVVASPETSGPALSQLQQLLRESIADAC